MVWTNYGPVMCNTIEGRPLKIADQTFAHGLYCHALSRVQVFLPGPGKSLSAVAGILTNPNSIGGSVVCSVKLGEKEVYASPLLHRGEKGVPVSVDLGGARDFFLCVGCAGDGISSDQVVWGDATVTLADGRSIRLGDLPIIDPLSCQRSAATPPFSFFYGGQHSDELLPKWRFQEERDTSKPRRLTRVRTYTDPQTGLVVRSTVVEYADFPTVEWTLSFKNTGTHDTPILAGILPLDTRLERGQRGEFLLHHFVGSPCQPNDYEPLETTLGPNASKRITTQGGRPTNSDLPYFNIENGSDGGMIVVIGWAGQWAAHFARDDGRGLRVTGGQEATSFRLHSGEEVRSPLVVLQFYRGDWRRSQNVWRSWMLEHNVPRRNGKILDPFIFVCNGNYYPGLMTDAATEFQFLRRYLEEGIHPDYWNQDAGWYPCEPETWPKVGTWEVDRKRWPKGIREVSDWLKTQGVKTITWFEPERVHAGTWLAENHPEWIIGGRGGGLLKIGEPECRRWITDRVDQLLTDEGIDFYRQDFNIDPLYYWRGNDAEDRQGITEIRHVEGYFAYWDELVRRHPNLWIDSCASGGRRNDLETLRRAVPILRSDWTIDIGRPNADPLDQQNHTYGISFWMPINGTGYTAVDKYWARSVMTTIHGIGVDTRRKDLDYDLLRKLYREVRQVQPCYLGDYYPLTPYEKGADAWAAWQFDRPDTGEGLVQAFRRRSSAREEARFKLRELDPNARYTVTNLDEPGASQEFAGSQLVQDGLVIIIRDQPGAAVFTYRQKK
jgi:alpha-galactosidase